MDVQRARDLLVAAFESSCKGLCYEDHDGNLHACDRGVNRDTFLMECQVDRRLEGSLPDPSLADHPSQLHALTEGYGGAPLARAFGEWLRLHDVGTQVWPASLASEAGDESCAIYEGDDYVGVCLSYDILDTSAKIVFDTCRGEVRCEGDCERLSYPLAPEVASIMSDVAPTGRLPKVAMVDLYRADGSVTPLSMVNVAARDERESADAALVVTNRLMAAWDTMLFEDEDGHYVAPGYFDGIPHDLYVRSQGVLPEDMSLWLIEQAGLYPVLMPAYVNRLEPMEAVRDKDGRTYGHLLRDRSQGVDVIVDTSLGEVRAGGTAFIIGDDVCELIDAICSEKFDVPKVSKTHTQ